MGYQLGGEGLNDRSSEGGPLVAFWGTGGQTRGHVAGGRSRQLSKFCLGFSAFNVFPFTTYLMMLKLPGLHGWVESRAPDHLCFKLRSRTGGMPVVPVWLAPLEWDRSPVLI